MKSPELLLPAGDLQRMRYAYAYGADAVYAGLPRYSLRVRNNGFNLENLGKGIEEAHQKDKLFFVATNLMPHNAKLRTFMDDMAEVIALQPDALIMADSGLIMMVREKWPEVPVHLSVQANTVNYAAVKFWQSLGLRRIILSRELSLNEIEEIRQCCPDMELEVFVHGALCIAYSGRCLLSGYFNHRDANQGSCTNSCRWEYKIQEDDNGNQAAEPIEFNAFDAMNRTALTENEKVERHPLADREYLIEEPGRPGEMMPINEDEHGTYIMNSKDLRAVEYVERLVKIGIDSLKIEGRTKSLYYVTRAAQVYRRAIDDAVAGRPFNPLLLAELDGLANRGYTPGFYQRHISHEMQNYLTGYSKSHKQKYVGQVIDYDSQSSVAVVDVKNKFAVGDLLEIIRPEGNQRITLESMENLNGGAIIEAPGGGYQVKIPIPAGSGMGLIARYLDP